MRIPARTKIARTTLPWIAALLLAVPGAAFGQTAADHNLPLPCQAQQDFSHQAEAIIAQQINAARKRLMPNAPALRFDEQLARIAELRSCELARSGRLSHLDDKGHLEAADLIYSVFAPYGLVGENLMEMNAREDAALPDAETFATTAAELWLKSPEHRQHILDPRYNLSGIGVAIVGGEAVATQVFHGPPRRQALRSSR